MAISAVQQPSATYQLWTRFSFPTANGPKDAVAVPAVVANQLNSAYTIMLGMLMSNFWTIVVALVILVIRHVKKSKNERTALLVTLWNQKSDLFGLIIQTYKCSKNGSNKQNQRDVGPAGLVSLVFLILAAWVGQKALNVLIPPLLILGNAAPVSPDVVYFPTNVTVSDAQKATRYALEIPPALRALGSADLENRNLREKVQVSQAALQGYWNKTEPIQRVDYSYQVSGADLGLQRYPELLLTVNGSCITEYGWHNGTSAIRYDRGYISMETYLPFGNVSRARNVSIFQGAEPSGTFIYGRLVNGTLDGSNRTWSALISSAERSSFTPGTDPWYLTYNDRSGFDSDAGYRVKPARPALSCWQEDVWSYKGRRSSIMNLNSEALPGLELSQAMQRALSIGLQAPMIYHMGARLGPSALKSATTAIRTLFDAKASSFQQDLERLVLASYVATTNVLTDSTLYPAEAPSLLPNAIKAGNGRVEQGAADFVVWSSDVSALSIAVLITIPTVFVAMWLLSVLLLNFTDLGDASSLDSNSLFNDLKGKDSSEQGEQGKGLGP